MKGNLNAVLGYNAAASLRGNLNVVLGANAAALSNSSSSTLVGAGAGLRVTGDFNTGVGSRSSANVFGAYNSATGYGAAMDCTGNFNTAAGALSALTVRGNLLTAVGYATASNVVGDGHTLVGAYTGAVIRGNLITAIGTSTATMVTGDRITILGSNTAGNLMSVDSVFVGSELVTGTGGTAFMSNAIVTTSNVFMMGSDIQQIISNFNLPAAPYQPLILGNSVILGAGLNVDRFDSDAFVVGLNPQIQDARALQLRSKSTYVGTSTYLGSDSGVSPWPSQSWAIGICTTLAPITVATAGTYRFRFTGTPTTSSVQSFVSTATQYTEPEYTPAPSSHLFDIFFKNVTAGVRTSALSLQSFSIPAGNTVTVSIWQWYPYIEPPSPPSNQADWINGQLDLVQMVAGSDFSLMANIDNDTGAMVASMVSLFSVPSVYGTSSLALAAPGALFVQPGYFTGNTDVAITGGATTTPRLALAGGNVSVYEGLVVDRQGADATAAGGAGLSAGSRWTNAGTAVNNQRPIALLTTSNNQSGLVLVHASTKSTANPKTAVMLGSWCKNHAAETDVFCLLTHKVGAWGNCSLRAAGNVLYANVDTDVYVTRTVLSGY